MRYTWVLLLWWDVARLKQPRPWKDHLSLFVLLTTNNYTEASGNIKELLSVFITWECWIQTPAKAKEEGKKDMRWKLSLHLGKYFTYTRLGMFKCVSLSIFTFEIFPNIYSFAGGFFFFSSFLHSDDENTHGHSLKSRFSLHQPGAGFKIAYLWDEVLRACSLAQPINPKEKSGRKSWTKVLLIYHPLTCFFPNSAYDRPFPLMTSGCWALSKHPCFISWNCRNSGLWINLL